MNFFKAVFADDEPLSDSEPKDDDDSNRDHSGTDSEPDVNQSNPNSTESAPVASGGWDFGGLIKTLATKSESVIDTYKRDLQEFSTGLKAETAVFREVANRAVKELPKAGVSTFDELKTTVLKGTTQILSQGKEALLSLDQEISSAEDKSGGDRSLSYNRFDARLRAIQFDKETYCVEPEDLGDYEKWKSGFLLEEKGEELGKLFEDNAAMENIYHKIVPIEIDPETFWYRYFYKVYKLKQAEEVRASFLKKAIDDDEEELSWDVDEEDEDSDGGSGSSGKVRESAAVPEKKSGAVEVKKDSGSDGEIVGVKKDSGSDGDIVKVKKDSGSDGEIVEVKKDSGSDGDIVEVMKDSGSDKDIVEVKKDPGNDSQVSKGNVTVDDDSVVKQEVRDVDLGKAEDKVDETSHANENKTALPLEKEVKGKSDASPSKAEPATSTDEDLEWDEIEDEGSDGDKPEAPHKRHDKAELQKRLSSAVEDEDLSWDIEDDDEPVKH